jgi:hypothetical protein
MEKISTGGIAYKCANGEMVTISFVAHHTDMRITYRFEDEDTSRVVQGSNLEFTMVNPLRILRVFFHFINEAGTGGSYDVKLSGSAGGEFPDPPPVEQAGDFVPFRRYAFVT